ncbi:MAG: hypothetical protein COA88_07190 [Kordia sp.]|nr:MAG: hypothetical protein COA88_07190 [Kordia sp.]
MVLILIINIKLKKETSFLTKKKEDVISSLKKNGRVVEISPNDFDVIKNDSVIKTGYFKSSNIYGFKFLKRAKYNVKDLTHEKSIIVCSYINEHNEIKKLTKHISINHNLLEAKIRMSDIIYVYFDKSNPEEYYIDLEFLDN